MEAKKNPKYALNKFGGIFFNLGLITSLSFVLVAMNWDFKSVENTVQVGEASGGNELIIPPITDIPPPQPPKPKVIAREFVETKEPELKVEDFDIVIDQEEIFDFEPTNNVDIEPTIEEEAEEVYLIVEEMPGPVGGYESFYGFLAENLRYPAAARRLGVEGKVFVKFVVDKNGKLINPVIVKGIGGGCDEEAIRVINEAPNWKPGKQRGVPVRVQVILPVHFMLAGSSSS